MNTGPARKPGPLPPAGPRASDYGWRAGGRVTRRVEKFSFRTPRHEVSSRRKRGSPPDSSYSLSIFSASSIIAKISSTPRLEVSMTRASSAGRNGLSARVRSWTSRSRIWAAISDRSTGRPRVLSWSTRRCARTSGEASRKNLYAHVAALGHQVVLPAQGLLGGLLEGAHLGQGGRVGGEQAHGLAAYLRRQGFPVQRKLGGVARAAQIEAQPGQTLGEFLGSQLHEPRAQHPGRAPVHGPGVEPGHAQPSGQQPGQGGLAHARGAVDGHDEAPLSRGHRRSPARPLKKPRFPRASPRSPAGTRASRSFSAAG